MDLIDLTETPDNSGEDGLSELPAISVTGKERLVQL